VWSEGHRVQCLGEIDADLAWCRSIGEAEEIPRLDALRREIVASPLGEEWLDHVTYTRVAEDLDRRGLLGTGDRLLGVQEAAG
jgi:hypothetical protein